MHISTRIDLLLSIYIYMCVYACFTIIIINSDYACTYQSSAMWIESDQK